MAEKRTIYLAYGSNLNISQMAQRCPEAKPWGATLLHGYQLAFWGRDGNAFATIVSQKDACVPVALWSITAKDEQALDTYEGWPRHYRKEMVRVPWGKRNVNAMVYFNLDPEPLFQALWDAQKAHLRW